MLSRALPCSCGTLMREVASQLSNIRLTCPPDLPLPALPLVEPPEGIPFVDDGGDLWPSSRAFVLEDQSPAKFARVGPLRVLLHEDGPGQLALPTQY